MTNGIIWVWYHPDEHPPSWPAPAHEPANDDGAHYPVFPHCAKQWKSVRARPQYVLENNADMDHLHWVHGAKGTIEMESFEPDGPCIRSRIRMLVGGGHSSTWLTPNGAITAYMVAEAWGMGLIKVRFSGSDDSILLQTQTAVDEDHCDMFTTVLVRRSDGATGDEPTGAAAARIREQIRQVERDLVIWENMVYVNNPALVGVEGKHVVALRRWAAQFYAPAEDVQPARI